MGNTSNNSLTVLMSVYVGETPKYLEQSIDSVFNQSLIPSKLVLVQDGPLNQALEKTIDELLVKYEDKIHIIKLPSNCGLAVALNKGLCDIKTKYIARMDTDDVCKQNRFERQVKFLQENPHVDIVGSWIDEIDENNELIKECVRFPVNHEDCFKFFQKRNPVVHPSVVFKQSFFSKIGGLYDEKYVGNNKQEDTDLWFRGFLSGCVFANVPEVLLNFRRNSKFYERRSGLTSALLYLKCRVEINRSLGYGLLSDVYAVLYLVMTISPSFIKKLLYQCLR